MSTASQTTEAPTTVKADGLVRLPLPALRIPAAAKVDVYVLLPDSPDPRLLWSRKFVITEVHLAELRNRGFHVLWTTRSDAQHVAEVLNEAKATYFCQPEFSGCEQFTLLQFAAIDDLDGAYRMLRRRPYVERCLELGPELATALVQSGATAREFFPSRLRGASPAYRFTVLAGYAVLLAQGLGVTNLEDLCEIAVGALVHDVGWQGPPSDSRPGRWSEEERIVIEGHPQRGFEELQAMQILSREQLLMAYQHHERIDGSGYPVAVLGDEIHLWAKILAVVDRFDALSMSRAARRPLTLTEAIEHLDREAGITLDAEVTRCWTSMLQTS